MARIDLLAPFILSWEGGFANLKYDRGGATNRGVTIATWKQQGYDKDGDGDIDVADLKLITAEDATEMMRKNFWNRWRADEIKSQSVANILVDWVWGSGAYGIKLPQKILGVKIDGIVGAKTIAAVNARDPRELFAAIKKERAAFIERIVTRNKTQKRFYNGWMRRLNGIEFERLTYSNGKRYTFKDHE